MIQRLIVFGFCLLPLALFADEPAPASEATKPVAEAPQVKLQKPETDSDDAKSSGEDLTVTSHTVKIAGKSISYTATAGTLPVPGDDEKTKANIFFIAYTVDADQASRRPITYCFNGGPGSSSVWLHLGMLGPKRVKLPGEPVVAAPPAEVISNPFSLLDITDLVFIDPVSTGYSRPLEGEKKEQFHGFTEDIESVGRFIHLYTTKYSRWGSPKFLCGESYGTLRAAGLAEHLQDRYNLELNGIVLVSTVLDFQTLLFQPTNDLPYILFLPSFTATAWYHNQLDEDLQKLPLHEVVDLAREFALGPYATALLKGASLPDDERKEVIAAASTLTGLSKSYLRRSNLRVSMDRFGKQLLKQKGLILGRFDSRYVGPDRDAAAEGTGYDPSAAALFGAFTSALYQYVRSDLGVEKVVPYEILTGKVHPWNYDQFTNRYVDSSIRLSEAMVKNPHLKIFVANGYYDLATPFAAAEYTFSRLLPTIRQQNVILEYYEGGHMMYVHEPSLEKLRQDLLQFYESAVPALSAPEN